MSVGIATCFGSGNSSYLTPNCEWAGRQVAPKLLVNRSAVPRSQIDQRGYPRCALLPLFNLGFKKLRKQAANYRNTTVGENNMYIDSTNTGEIQDLLAISAEYLGMGTDPVVACRDRSVEPFGDFDESAPSSHDDSERLQTIVKQ